MNIQEFFIVTNQGTKEGQFISRPQIICNDGFSFSCQAGKGIYSSPRDKANEYKSAEIGYPSQFESLLLEHADNQDEPTDTTYAYVPTEVIQKVIEKHGGINLIETFK